MQDINTVTSHQDEEPMDTIVDEIELQGANQQTSTHMYNGASNMPGEYAKYMYTKVIELFACRLNRTHGAMYVITGQI